MSLTAIGGIWKICKRPKKGGGIAVPLVDLRIYWPWGLLMTLLRGAIVFLAAHVFLKDRFHPLVSFTTILAVSVLYGAVGVRFPEAESYVMFTYYLVVFVVLLGIKRGKVFSKLMTALFALVCYQIGTLAAALLELFVQPNALFCLRNMRSRWAFS